MQKLRGELIDVLQGKRKNKKFVSTFLDFKFKQLKMPGRVYVQDQSNTNQKPHAVIS